MPPASNGPRPPAAVRRFPATPAAATGSAVAGTAVVVARSVVATRVTVATIVIAATALAAATALVTATTLVAATTLITAAGLRSTASVVLGTGHAQTSAEQEQDHGRDAEDGGGDPPPPESLRLTYAVGQDPSPGCGGPV